ncbi:Protein of unknown function (DUF4238) [Actinokineospora diospyrosa]|uniref:DUF4238 domain-containing protein n=1 Tax=Actinokineospora diospyrosa TaxID=103728 RepID=A0ABT1I5T0_9PSEU|nr:Protein of unknown function (DUF4238) [Actinokineospora diospyrosa]
MPRFYLDAFARDGQIGTVELPGVKRFVQSVRYAATMNNFYSLDTPDPGDSDTFEAALGAFEGVVAPIIRSVVQEDTWPLPPEQRRALAEFAVVQHLRGPDQRRAMEQIMAATTKIELSIAGREHLFGYAREHLGREVSEAEADMLWEQVISPTGPPITLSPRGHIEQIIEAVPDFTKYILGRPWVLVRFDRKKLFTCDTPVALLPDPQSPPVQGIGLINAWSLTLPLARSVGLMMIDPIPFVDHLRFEDVAQGQADTREPPTSRLANMFNHATARNARRWIFHHPDDSSLIGNELPPPRTTEISFSGASTDFVDMGARIRANRTDGHGNPAADGGLL